MRRLLLKLFFEQAARGGVKDSLNFALNVGWEVGKHGVIIDPDAPALPRPVRR